LYRIDGDYRCDELTLDHLEGYRGSRPVRIGNGAATQVQLDIYGELLNAAAVRFNCGLPLSRIGVDSAIDECDGPRPETWRYLCYLISQVAERWCEPDAGIWEVRGGAQQFLYSRLMCWVALDRGIRLARR